MWAKGSRTRSILALTHPTGVVVFGASSLLLSFIARRDSPDIGLSLRLTFALILASAASGVMNDILDVDIDRIAKPWRAIPAGDITVQGASAMAGSLVILAVAAAASLSPLSSLFLAIGLGVSLLYSARLKRTPLSWLPYAVAYPSVPVWIWISLGVYRPPILAIYLLGAPLVIATHMVNQLRDYAEDERLGLKGLVLTLGRPRATTVCYALLGTGPLPLLLTRWQPTEAFAPLLLWGAALLYWSLIVPAILNAARNKQDHDFRRIFRALQLCVPLLLTAWLVDA